MISHRFVPVVCLLLAAALVPTIIHSYSGAAHDDRRTTAAIPAVLVGHDSVPSDRAATWGKRRFDSDDWTERVYSNVAGQKLRFSVALTLDMGGDTKKLDCPPPPSCWALPSWMPKCWSSNTI